MDNYNYPMGADGPDAPWNEPDDIIIPVTGTVYIGFNVPIDSEVTWADISDMRQEAYEQMSKPDEIIKMIQEGKLEQAINALKAYEDFEVCDDDLEFHEPTED